MMKTKICCVLGCILILSLWLSGCATTGPGKEMPLKLAASGAMVYDNEFEFTAPPTGWSLVQVESGGEFGFGFMKSDAGSFPSQSMYVFDEEPFGCSTEFETREKEFFGRYLWASPISMDIKILEREKVRVVGGEGLAVIAEGKDPVRGEKVKSKIVFGRRGPRVVAWYLTQWRPFDGTYDSSAFEIFDAFWRSFKFLKKSFYETL